MESKKRSLLNWFWSMLGNLFKFKISPKLWLSYSLLKQYLERQERSEQLILGSFFLGRLEEVPSPSPWLLYPLSQSTSSSNIVPTPYQYCTPGSCQAVHSKAVGVNTWKWCVVRPSVSHPPLAKQLSWACWGLLPLRWFTELPGVLLLCLQ